MALSRQFACSFLAFGSVAMLGTAMLTGSLGAHTQGSTNGALREAIADANSSIQEVSSEIKPQLKSLSDSTNTFVSANATTGRLQVEGMANSVGSHLTVDALTPAGAPQWTQGGIAHAAQVSGGQMISLSAKVPMIQAVKSGIGRMGEIRPSLH